MAPDVAALKLKHAEHILEVVRGAEKQEATRQRKLRHATSKANLAYLQKRFDAERRLDQTHISGLVHDANAVEAALRRGSQNKNRRPRDKSVDARGDSDSCGGDVAASVEGSVGTNTGSKESNAYVQPGRKEDPNFISLDQMRFMKYVYAHVDNKRAARAHTRLMAQLVGAEKSADNLQERRQSPVRRRGGKDATLSALGKADAGTLTSSGRRREQSVRGALSSQPHGGGGNVGDRQRLLLQKREILLQMKGVAQRQAEALDRLVESNANVNRAAQAGGRNGGNISSRRRSFQGSYGGSTTSSSALHEGTESDRRACSKAAGPSTRRPSYPDVPNLVVHSTPAMLASSTNGAQAPPPLPPLRPPENDTSAFLARGGRWGGERRHGTSRRDSLASASTASYATYCNRSVGGGRAALRTSRRPAAVPVLRPV